MDNKETQDAVFEALLGQAVIEEHLREMDELDSEEAYSYTFSPEHEKKMKAMFASRRRKENLKTFLFVSKQLAAGLVIAAACLFIVLMTNHDVRTSISETIMQWREQFTSLTEDKSSIVWRPSYIPEGFFDYSHWLDSAEVVVYKNSAGETIYFESAFGRTLNFDDERAYEVVEKARAQYHVFHAPSSEYRSHIVWKKDGFVFELYSGIDTETLLEMAVSVGKEK